MKVKRAWCAALLLSAIVMHIAAQSLPAGQARLNAGVNLYSQGKLREAVSELRRAQAEASSRELRGEALFWISLAELSAGRYAEAIKDMDALIEADPQNKRLKELPYHRGRALYYLGNYDEAIILLKRYADSIQRGAGGNSGGILSPADSSRKASALYWTGECLFSLGQLDRAGDMFRIITEEYPRNPKYEASLYRLALINQKKVENELLGLLKLSHEESLRNMEEFRRKEAAYDQAVRAYQKRIADLLAQPGSSSDPRLSELIDTNARYQEQLELARNRIRSLETNLAETSSALDKARDSAAVERLRVLKTYAEELENRIPRSGR